jgi:putative hydrolase of the HAD superfamily
MQGLRVVTFDCWSTLIYERDPGQAYAQRVEAAARVARLAGRSVDAAAARRALDAAWTRHSAAWHEHVATGSVEMAAWTLEGLGVPAAEARSAGDELARAFAEASLASEIVPLEGARETLERLAARGRGRALVCDTGFSPGRVVRQLLDRAGLLPLLEVQAFSDEVGVPKPDRRIFEHALSGLRAEPGEALHVGDLRRTDVAGARVLGMRTVRIRHHHDDRSEHPEADHVADSHADLREILGLAVA